MADVRLDRATTCHYCPAWITGLWLTLGILTLLFAGACRQAPEEKRPAPVARRPNISSPATAPTAPPARASRPRGPAYRVDNGLGAPKA